MEKITAINGQVLKWARERNNMSISFVAEKLNRDSETIIAWEEGTDYPTYAQLENLGELYKKPVAVFFFPNIPNIPSVKASFRTLPEFTFNVLSHKFIKQINNARVMQINLYELNEGKNPASILLANLNFQKNIKDAAKELRHILGVSLEEQKSIKKFEDAFEFWRDRFHHLGIYVFKEAFKDNNVSGFCLYDEVFPIIYINNSMSFGRQIFTLFHEVYHLIYRTSGIDKIHDDYFDYLTKEQLQIEQACNAFAGEFLVPDHDFNKEINNKSINDLLVYNLANKYKVSREVIMRKLLNMKLISKDEYENKREEFIAEAIRFREKKKEAGGNHYYNQISYLGSAYLHLVFDRYEKNKINIFQLSDYTRTKIENLPKLERALGWGISR